ncbi:MAG: DNA primase [Rhodospirillales bacterium]|nr:DNA primase [Rhodospirillales bacterium]
MTFPPQFLDEVRARVPLEGVIGKRVRVVRRGREFIGLCPFHKEKTPSFTVNEEKGFFHCFGCGAHGDVIGFLMRDEGLPFPEAVERLAADAGLALPARDPQAAVREKERHSLFGVMEAAAAWFESELKGTRGAAARRYLDARAVDEATRAHFRLGFAPDSRNALRTALEKDGITEAMLLEAGLIVTPDDDRSPYDRFRGRVIFPICDRRGRVVAFGGRTLGERQPKYLNSPETPLFAKGSLLYGYHLAAGPARKANRVIAVEGYMDVIALHQAGIARAVAPLGTALTEQQLESMWRLAEEPVLCFDGDEAGARAAARAVERALSKLSAKRSLRFATLPAGQDPDTMVRDRGRQAMAEIVGAAIPFSDQLWKMASGGRSLDTPEARARAHKQLQDQVARIPDSDLGFRYMEEFRHRLRLPWQGRRQGGAPSPAMPESPVRRGEALGPGGQGTTQPRERALLQILLNFPALAMEQHEALAGLHLETPRFAAVVAALIDWAESGPEPESADLRAALAGKGLDGVVEELVGQSAHVLDRPASIDHARELFADALNRQHQRLEEQAARAEAEGAYIDEETWQQTRERILRLQETAKAETDLPDLGVAPRASGA